MRQDNRRQSPYVNVAMRRPNPWILWLVVTVLWTSATFFAIRNRWPQIHDTQNAFADWLVWLCLLLPPAIFAAIIGATFGLTSSLRKKL